MRLIDVEYENHTFMSNFIHNMGWWFFILFINELFGFLIKGQIFSRFSLDSQERNIMNPVAMSKSNEY